MTAFPAIVILGIIQIGLFLARQGVGGGND
jgi:hypothetical protein